jgi:hypothetical protein
MCSLLLFQPHMLGLWSTNQLSLWSWSFRLKIGVFFRCLLSKVIFFVLIRNIISTVFWYYPLFVAICVIWLSRLTYGVYLVLSLKPGAIKYFRFGGISWLTCSHVRLHCHSALKPRAVGPRMRAENKRGSKGFPVKDDSTLYDPS